MKKTKKKTIVVFSVLLISLTFFGGCIFDSGGSDDEEETALSISLSSPANGADDQETTVELVWSGDGSVYDVYLDEENPPTTKVANDVSDNNYTMENLDYETTYYWYVEATKDGTTESSGIRSFTTMAEIVEPSIDLEDSLVASYPLQNEYDTSSKYYGVTGGYETDNGYMEFDGEDDYVHIGSVLNFSDDFSISGWLNFDKINSYHNFVSKADGHTKIHIESDGQLYYRDSTGSLANNDIGGFEIGTFSFLCVVRSGNSIKAYKDGIEYDVGVSNGTFGVETIGRDLFDDWILDGSIDEVTIYNTALTESEIAELYNKGQDDTKPTTQADNIVYYNPMNSLPCHTPKKS